MTFNARVYAWGTFRGANGIFGFSPDVEVQATPYLIDLKNVVKISAGTNHLVAFTKDGKIFTWGIGEQGQLGRKIMTRNVLEASLTPRAINFRPYRKTAKFTNAFCGGYHTVLVHESNSLFSFGLNNYGQLGLGDLDEHDIPDLVDGIVLLTLGVPTDEPIVDIDGGEHFTVILNKAGSVYVCGRNDRFFQCNDSGQLGLPSEDFQEHCSTGTRLRLPKVKFISCGASFSLAVTQENNLYAWGYGEMGQLANDGVDAPIPIQVELKGRQVLGVSGGGQHSVFLLAPKE